MYLGIDYGRKRIGLALGEYIPKGAGVVENTSESLVFIENLCRQNEVNKIIFGLPKKPSGEEGDLVPEINSLATKLRERLGVEIDFEEEQYTSVEAEKLISEYRSERGVKDMAVDELAAVLILEQYIGEKSVDQD